MTYVHLHINLHVQYINKTGSPPPAETRKRIVIHQPTRQRKKSFLPFLSLPFYRTSGVIGWMGVGERTAHQHIPSHTIGSSVLSFTPSPQPANPACTFPTPSSGIQIITNTIQAREKKDNESVKSVTTSRSPYPPLHFGTQRNPMPQNPPN